MTNGGMTPAQRAALRTLAKSETKSAWLSASIGPDHMHPTTANVLVRLGLATFVPDPNDAKLRWVEITDEGERIAAVIG